METLQSSVVKCCSIEVVNKSCYYLYQYIKVFVVCVCVCVSVTDVGVA